MHDSLTSPMTIPCLFGSSEQQDEILLLVNPHISRCQTPPLIKVDEEVGFDVEGLITTITSTSGLVALPLLV